MQKRSSGTAWGNWLVHKTSGILDAKLSRRSFIARTTLLGTAVAATGCAVVTQPGTPYQSVAGCSGGECTDGYTEFCCVINEGMNTCPDGSAPGGWWRAEGSIYCGGGPRYYIDCNQLCCGPYDGNGFCAGCEPCRCAVNCDTRRVYCNYFRYGQCNEDIAIMGPIACRVVLCVAPYAPYSLLACAPSNAEDDSTANHTADCAAYTPPPPPPPPPAVPPALSTVLPSSGAAIAVGGNPVVAACASGGALSYAAYNGSAWGAFTSLYGAVNSQIVGADQGSNGSVFLRQSTDNAIYESTDTAGTWSASLTSLGGTLTSDPSVTVDDSGTAWVFARGLDSALFVTNPGAGGVWTRLGGVITSDAAAVVDHGGTIWAFIRGTYGDVWKVAGVPPTTWGALVSMGGNITSNPASVVDGAGTIWVFGRGSDDALWGATVQSSSWTSYGGQLASDPVPIVDAAGTLWVFSVDGTGAIQAISPGAAPVSLGTWPGGGTFTADPAAVVAGGTLWVFAVGSDNAMWARQYNGTSWPATQWQSLGGTLAPIKGS